MEIERSHLISVILPVYNGEKTIEEAVNSVLSQTYDKFELIIINDGSTDGTKDILKRLADKDSRIIVITNEKNIGVLKTRLKGVRASAGKWIAFIDSDDFWRKDKLARQVRLQNETGCDLIYSGSGYQRFDGSTVSWELHVPAEITYKKLLKQNLITNCSVVIRKDLFLKYTPISEDNRDIHEDYACWLLLLKEGYKAFGIDEPLVTYRLSRKSMTGNKLHSAVLNWYTYRVVGLNVIQTSACMICYTFKSLFKYSHFMKKG